MLLYWELASCGSNHFATPALVPSGNWDSAVPEIPRFSVNAMGS
jgi:hypothetical protein